MKKGWEIKTIGDVCKVIAGQSPEGKFYNNNGSGMPFYQGKKEYGEKYIGEPTTWTTKVTKEAEANDVLMSVRAPVGPINFATQKICIGRGLAAIRPTKLIDKEFLYSFLLKHESEIVGNTGAVFNSINKAQIENIEIPLPPLPEQQRIVAILDEAFAAIAKAKDNAEQNLKNAKELFESYLQGVFENKGEGWESKELMEVCEQITDGSHFSPKSSGEDEYPYITVRDIDEDIIDFDNCKFICKQDYQSLLKNGCKPNNGDLLFSKDGTVGKVSLVDFEKDFVVLSSLAIIRPKAKIITSSLLKYILKNPQFLQTAIGMKTGVAIRRIILKNLKLIEISFPKSLKEQQVIVQKLDALSTETQKLEAIYIQKIDDLEELKKSVLQKAFSGELKTKKVVAV